MKLRVFLGAEADHILGPDSRTDQLEESRGRILDNPTRTPHLHYNAPPPREPTMQEVMDLSMAIVGKARQIPGGLYQLQRMLKRFEKDHVDPIE